MNKYYIHEWVAGEYILIDTLNSEVRFFKTNYENKMGTYHLENPTIERVSNQKINGLIKRTQSEMNLYNSYVIDRFLYNYIMNDEQRKKCKQVNILSAIQKKLITSGNDYNEVIQEMQRVINTQVS